MGGFAPPSGRNLVVGVGPEPQEPQDFEPGSSRDGWQHEAASRVEESFRETNLFPRMGTVRQALMWSQGGAGAGLALSRGPIDNFHPASIQGDPWDGDGNH